MREDSRSNLHASFFRYFADSHAAGRVVITDEDLAALAATLSTVLPNAYVQFMLEHGPAYCPTILRLTLEFEMEHPDLRQFLTPAQVLQKSREGWKRVLPSDLFVFATDCMGNPFCFRRSKEIQEDAPVYFLGMQHEEPISLGESFDDVLRWYVEHVRQVSVPLKSS